MRLSAPSFNRFLNRMGQSFGWRRGFACPCLDRNSGQPKFNCSQCGGKGRLWGAVVEGSAGIVSQSKVRNYAPHGVWDKDDIALSIPSDSPLYAMGQFDRVMARNRTEPFSMALVRGMNDVLRFEVLSIERAFWLDASEVIHEASIPVVNPNGSLTFPGEAPPSGITFSITGRRAPEYFCYLEMPTDRPMHYGEPLPRRVVLRRFDLFGSLMAKFSIDLGPLLASHGIIAQSVFPLVSQAVRAVTEEAAFRWKQQVMHASLWEVEKQQYVESISWRMVTPLEGEVTTGFKLAGQIENGRPPRDLKKVLSSSRKVRVAKSGKHAGQRYLIIPFRHNTPGNSAHAKAMPGDVYSKARVLATSRLLPPGSVNPAQRLSGSGHLVAQHSYQWGGRLPAGLAPKLKPGHHSDPYAGMVRFDTSTGGAKSSSYLTFRVMGAWSSGWVVPAKPGLKLVDAATEGLQDLLDEAVGEAVKLTIQP